MKRSIKQYIFVITLVVVSTVVFGQQRRKPQPPKSRILFIFDASQSMSGKWESNSKIKIARKMLIRMIDSLEQISSVQMALRVYGHQSPVPPQDCHDTKLEVPFSENNASRIRQKLRYLVPKGTTPMAYSLKMAERDFPKCDECRNIVVIITDGIEACEGDPCEVSKYLQGKGITLKPFVIGIGYDPEFQKTLKCIGHFYNADKEERFEEVLNIVISQALNTTSAQINLLDSYGNPTETNIPMTFYDKISGKPKLNLVHTINHRGNPDTIFLDPLVFYKAEIHTIPPVFIDSVQTTPGKHSIFAIDAPQGDLQLKIGGRTLYRNLTFLVRRKEEKGIIYVGDVSDKHKLLTGKYDIEVLSLPRLKIKDVEIKQSHTTTVEIPQPGIATILKPSEGYGGIYVKRNDKLELVVNLKENNERESFILLPGEYYLVFRSKNMKQANYSISKKFSIKSGGSIPVDLF